MPRRRLNVDAASIAADWARELTSTHLPASRPEHILLLLILGIFSTNANSETYLGHHLLALSLT